MAYNIPSVVGRLTSLETKEMLTACIDALPDTDVMELLDECLKDEVKDELGLRWIESDENER